MFGTTAPEAYCHKGQRLFVRPQKSGTISGTGLGTRLSERTARVHSMVTLVDINLPPLGVSADVEPPDLSVLISGELDFSAEGALDGCDQLDLAGVRRITVDLSGLDFIDTAGVRTLRDFHDSQRSRDRDVVMVRSARHVRRLFTMLGVEDYLAAA